jgi:Zn-dependent protease with chaperone function
MFTKMTNLQLATELGSIIIDRFFAAVASFNQEMTADVFAASMGYGPQLRSALRKLEASMTGSTTTSDQTNAFIHKFLSHPTTDKRVDYIEQVEKHFKQQTNKLIQKSTEVITTELNKEKASV